MLDRIPDQLVDEDVNGDSPVLFRVLGVAYNAQGAGEGDAKYRVLGTAGEELSRAVARLTGAEDLAQWLAPVRGACQALGL